MPTGTGTGTGENVKVTSKIPKEVLILPVGEPKANPELILGPAQPVPQKVPQIILLPANQLQVPAQPPPGPRPASTTRLPAQVTSISISTSPLNSATSTVHPSSTFVSSTASKTTTAFASSSILAVSLRFMHCLFRN